MGTVEYINYYPRRWRHLFPEIEAEIPELFTEAGKAEVVRKVGTNDFLVTIDLHQPAKVG